MYLVFLAISLFGNVTQDAEEILIIADPESIDIDTLVTPVYLSQAAAGSITYKGNGRYDIEVSLTTNPNANILSFTASDLKLVLSNKGTSKGLSDFSVSDIKRYVLKDNNNYKIAIIAPLNITGTLTITISGRIYQIVQGTATITTSDGIINRTIEETYAIDTSSFTKTFDFDTETPKVIDTEIPTIIKSGIWDIYIAFNVKVKGLDIDDFIQDGVKLYNSGNEPKIYRWTGTDEFDVNMDTGKAPTNTTAYKADVPDDLDTRTTTNFLDTYSNWQNIASDMPLVSSKYFLIRFYIKPIDIADQEGTYNISLKKGAVTTSPSDKI